MDFIKMHGLGNDFVIINNIGLPTLMLPRDEIIAICDRHFGVGCDQLIVLESAMEADASMRIYNPDGGEAGACGNATRCVAKLLKARAIKVGDRLLKTTVHGDEVSVDMGPYTEAMPIEVMSHKGFFLDIGNPHFVMFGDADIKSVGAQLATLDANINIARITSSSSLSLEVWERGAGHTLACGSGACATAIVAHKCMGLESKIDVLLPGGSLQIVVSDESVVMVGEAMEVFRGKWR